MSLTLNMGGGSVQTDWPELEREIEDNDGQAPDPDADPNLTDDEPRGVPASDPESGA